MLLLERKTEEEEEEEEEEVGNMWNLARTIESNQANFQVSHFLQKALLGSKKEDELNLNFPACRTDCK